MDASPDKAAVVDVGTHRLNLSRQGRAALNGGESSATCSRARAIAAILADAIVSHRLKPGAKLVEKVLADVLGVSRTVVRQATIYLAGEGLVSIEQNRGAFVSDPTFQEALDICGALIMIEQAVAVHLVNHLQPSGWMALKRRVAELSSDLVVERRTAAMLDLDFRSMLVRLTHNTVTCAIHAQLVRRTAAFLSFDEMDLDCRDLAHRRSIMIDQMERGRVLQVAAMIERHYFSLLRDCFREPTASRKMTSNEVGDCLAKMVDAASFSPSRGWNPI
jgi:DNA-binding GntR family transcriptional regulator